MIALAISVLWFLIGLIILCGTIWGVMWVIEQFIMPIPVQLKKAVWVIVLILAIIALLTALSGGGGGFHMPSLR